MDQVIPISRPYKLASSELSHHAPTAFDVDGRRVGGGETFCLIAGPCTVESPEQTRAVAAAVAGGGASMLRGGAFKPRTSPFSFQGLGDHALAILTEVRAETGLPVVSEMTSVELADRFAETVDVVQVGARNMQNYGLLEVVGRMGKPVLLKRGLSSTSTSCCRPPTTCSRRKRARDPVRAGHPHLRHRHALHARPRRGAVAQAAHPPAGRRSLTPRATGGLVGPLSRAAAAVGADGIIVEVAEDPRQPCVTSRSSCTPATSASSRPRWRHAGLVGRAGLARAQGLSPADKSPPRGLTPLPA